MKLQICFSPTNFLDVRKKEWKSAKEEIAFAKGLGAEYINLWVWASSLFWNTKSFDRLDPTAEQFYKDCIAECRRRNIAVIGKIGHWNLPYWAKPKPGIPELGSPAYGRQLESHQKAARTLSGELELDGWMVGNEPQLESLKYGYYPTDPDVQRYSAEDAIQIAIDKTKAVAPEFDGLTIGYCMEGIKTLPRTSMYIAEATKLYWSAVGDLLDYQGINAYPTTTHFAPSEHNYSRHYESLDAIAALWPSEQGIAHSWVRSDQQRWNWVDGLIAHTQSWSGVFSYFRLTASESTGDNWGLLRRDGSVDEVADLLRETFYKREKFHAVK